MQNDIIVLKVGGSLFDWPQLGPRLTAWLETLAFKRILLVPGGGPTVDVIRNLDQWHRLGEEESHWLALAALSVNAHFLAALLSRSVVITDLRDAETIWQRRELAIFDPFVFAQSESSELIPHDWSATSDSLAARIALRLQAEKLILLKSTQIPENWMDPGRGIVDSHFKKIVHSGQSRLEVSAFNLRTGRF